MPRPSQARSVAVASSGAAALNVKDERPIGHAPDHSWVVRTCCVLMCAGVVGSLRRLLGQQTAETCFKVEPVDADNPNGMQVKRLATLSVPWVPQAGAGGAAPEAAQLALLAAGPADVPWARLLVQAADSGMFPDPPPAAAGAGGGTRAGLRARPAAATQPPDGGGPAAAATFVEFLRRDFLRALGTGEHRAVLRCSRTGRPARRFRGAAFVAPAADVLACSNICFSALRSRCVSSCTL